MQPDHNMNIWELLNYSFFTYGSLKISILRVAIVVLILAGAYFIFRFFRKWMTHLSIAEKLGMKRWRSFLRIIRLVFIFGAGLGSLSMLGLKTSQVLAFQLFATDKVKFTVTHLLLVLVILFITRFILNLIEYHFDNKIKQKRFDRGRGRSIYTILQYLIWFTAVLVSLQALGLQLTWVVASSAAFLAGIGFGLQNLFSDFVSGLIILFDRSLEVYDIVELTDGTVGQVLEINLRASKILTRNNQVLIVPNSKFTHDTIVNWSHNEANTRFQVSVGVAYGSDVRLVEKLLLEAANGHDDISANPKPFVRFNDFGNSSLDFQLYFWTANSFYVENLKSELRFAIDDLFRRNKVEIPFPQRDVHFKNPIIIRNEPSE